MPHSKFLRAVVSVTLGAAFAVSSASHAGGGAPPVMRGAEPGPYDYNGFPFTSNLPIIKIETDGSSIGGRDDLMHEVRLCLLDGAQNRPMDDCPRTHQYVVRMRIRGNSSAGFHKKQYTVKFQRKLYDGNLLADEEQEDEDKLNVPLLGMTADNNWVLQAPYVDRTLMRNVVAYEQARMIFPWASRTHYVELILNGENHGVYVLTEKISRDRNKVNIRKWRNGGWIVKVDKGGQPIFRTHDRNEIEYVYPRPDDADALTMQTIREKFFAMEESFGQTGTSWFQDYSRHIDVDSFANFLLFQELWKNVDGLRRSLFLYGGRDGKIHAGPVWDVNIGGGNTLYFGGQTHRGWQHAIQFPDVVGRRVEWFNQLLRDPQFRARTHELFREYTRDSSSPFHPGMIRSLIDRNAIQLQTAQVRNFRKWPVLGVTLFPWFYFQPPVLRPTWRGEVYQNLVLFMERRVRWMTDHIQEMGVFRDRRALNY